MSNNDVNLAIAGYGITQADQWKIAKNDSTLAKMGKFAVEKAIVTGTLLASLIETTVSAVASALLYVPGKIILPHYYSLLSQHTLDSASTTWNTASRVFFGKKEAVEQAKEAKPAAPAAPTAPTVKVNPIVQFAKAHKIAILASTAVAAALTAAYFFGYRNVQKVNTFDKEPCQPLSFRKSFAENVFGKTNSFSERTIENTNVVPTAPSIDIDYDPAELPPLDKLIVETTNRVFAPITVLAAIVKNNPVKTGLAGYTTYAIGALLYGQHLMNQRMLAGN